MTGNPIVDAIGKIAITGNVIPARWFDTIRLPSGKPDLISINLLSEILYWYRPKIIRDEQSGRVIKATTRFQADKLRQSLGDLANLFGLSKKQVSDSIRRLKKQGMIDTELRIIKLENGVILNNVLHLWPIPEKILEITHGSDPPPLEGGRVSPGGGYPPPVRGGTYTEITTEITTERDPRGDGPPEKQKEIEKAFSLFWDNYPNTTLRDKSKSRKFFSLLVQDGLDFSHLQKAVGSAKQAASMGCQLPIASRFLGFGPDQPWQSWVNGIPPDLWKSKNSTGGPLTGKNVSPEDEDAQAYNKFKFI